MDLGAALLALLIGLVVKVAVLILGARLLLAMSRAQRDRPPARLWMMLPQSGAPEIRLIWWSLVLFYVSELTCGIEVYVLFRSNPWISSVHALTSATGMGLFALGIYRWFDRTVLRFRERGCTLNRICKGCTIGSTGECRFRAVLLAGAAFVALAAIFPVFVSTERLNADPTRYLLPFESLNAWYDTSVVPWLIANMPGYEPSGIAYFIHEAVMVVEFRVLPAIALLLSVGGFLAIRAGREAEGLHVVIFAAGWLSYSYFEMVLYAATDDVLIGSLGHEVAEFWFLVGLALFLRTVFPTPDPAHTPPQ